MYQKSFTARPLVEQIAQRFGQRRKVPHGRIPNDVRIDIEISVDQPVPHRLELRPRNVWSRIPELRRDASGGLSENLDVPHNRVQQHPVVSEIGPRTVPGKGERLAGSIEHVPYTNTV